jgi:hypothetical protein
MNETYKRIDPPGGPMFKKNENLLQKALPRSQVALGNGLAEAISLPIPLQEND